MKYPIITYKQMCKILKRNKYHFDRYSGDNAIYVKDGLVQFQLILLIGI